MSSKSGYLLHAWILPDNYLVEGVAMRGDDLIHVLGPHEVAHLLDSAQVESTWHEMNEP